MPVVTGTSSRVTLGIAALPMIPLALNQVIGTVNLRRQPPSFELLDTPGNTVQILCHGIWDGPGRFDTLLPIIQPFGPVIRTSNGSDVRQTPAAIISELKRLGWLQRPLHVIGLSLGTQTAVQFMRLMIRRELPVQRATLISGPARPRDVIWPARHLPWAVRLIQPGPIVELGWRRYWRQKIAEARAIEHDGHWHGLTAAAQWNLSRRSGIGISGARVLARGLKLRPGELAGSTVLIIEHTYDSLIRPCIDGWRVAAPECRHIVISGPGHGDFASYPNEYQAAFSTV